MNFYDEIFLSDWFFESFVLTEFWSFFVLAAYSDTDTVTNPDDLLPPLEKLQKYADSENIFNR